MKKLLVAMIFLLSTLCMSVTAFALTEGDWEYQLVEDHAVITGYNGSAEDVIIPDTLAGVPVTEVTCDNNADEYFNNGIIKSVTFRQQSKRSIKCATGRTRWKQWFCRKGLKRSRIKHFPDVRI